MQPLLNYRLCSCSELGLGLLNKNYASVLENSISCSIKSNPVFFFSRELPITDEHCYLFTLHKIIIIILC